MLICVTPPEAAEMTKGGETRVETSPGCEILSRASVTSGGGLLFRKDSIHEGMPVLEGVKEIVSLNLWATRRDGGEILVVTFPKEANATSDDGGKSMSPLQVSCC